MSTKTWNIALWTLQVLLALAFGMAGFMKLTQALEALATNKPWVAQSPAALVRFIGLSELLGGIGLILPALLRIRPALTVAAGAGLAVVMILAVLFHLFRGEGPMAAPALILGVLAALVSWGRIARAPIAAR